jgi:hypothetical protein
MKRGIDVGANTFMVRQAHHEGAIERISITGLWCNKSGP